MYGPGIFHIFIRNQVLLSMTPKATIAIDVVRVDRRLVLAINTSLACNQFRDVKSPPDCDKIVALDVAIG